MQNLVKLVCSNQDCPGHDGYTGIDLRDAETAGIGENCALCQLETPQRDGKIVDANAPVVKPDKKPSTATGTTDSGTGGGTKLPGRKRGGSGLGTVAIVAIAAIVFGGGGWWYTHRTPAKAPTPVVAEATPAKPVTPPANPPVIADPGPPAVPGASPAPTATQTCDGAAVTFQVADSKDGRPVMTATKWEPPLFDCNITGDDPAGVHYMTKVGEHCLVPYGKIDWKNRSTRQKVALVPDTVVATK